MVMLEWSRKVFDVDGSLDKTSAHVERHHVQPKEAHQVEVVHRSGNKHA